MLVIENDFHHGENWFVLFSSTKSLLKTSLTQNLSMSHNLMLIYVLPRDLTPYYKHLSVPAARPLCQGRDKM